MGKCRLNSVGMARQIADRGMGPAQRAIGILGQAGGAEFRGKRLVSQDFPGKPGAQAGGFLQHFQALQRSHHPSGGTQHAGLRTVLYGAGRRRFGKQAAIAGKAGKMALIGRELTLELRHRRRYQHFLGEEAGVIQQKAGGKIVRAVGDNVIALDQPHHIGGGEPHGMGLYPDPWIQGGQGFGPRLDLGPADVSGAKQDLARSIR